MSETTTAPDDEPTPAELEAFNNFDPLIDVPTNFEVIGNPRVNAEPTLSSFSREQQEIIRQRAGSADPVALQNAMHGFLLEKKREFLIKGGAGPGSTETMRTSLEQANRVGQLQRDIASIDAQLADVLEYRTEPDATGSPQPVPVYRLQGDSRSAFEARKRELGHEMVLIAGVQGERELRAANRTDALNARKARQQVEEFRQAETLAQQIARDERVRKMAETKAKFLRDTLG
jgi:hypothetical protein